MKIISRPEKHQMGSGNFTMKMDLEDIQLLCAYLGITRLGDALHDSIYKASACKLINVIEASLGEDFFNEAFDKVDMLISKVVSGNGLIIEQFDNSAIMLEV